MGKASEAERERSGVTMEELKGIARMHYRKHRRVKRLGQMKKIVCVLGIITICILIIGAATGKDRVIIGYRYESTNTLWGPLEYCPEYMNRWEYMELIKELNGMNGDTVYADRLYMIPIFNK